MRFMGGAGVSEREAEVLDLLAQRLTNAEIAARLFVSVRTVESDVSALLRKLGASNRRALAEMAGGASGPSSPWAGVARARRPITSSRPRRWPPQSWRRPRRCAWPVTPP